MLDYTFDLRPLAVPVKVDLGVDARSSYCQSIGLSTRTIPEIREYGTC